MQSVRKELHGLNAQEANASRADLKGFKAVQDALSALHTQLRGMDDREANSTKNNATQDMAARRLSKKMYKTQKFQILQKIPSLQNMNYEIYIYYKICLFFWKFEKFPKNRK